MKYISKKLAIILFSVYLLVLLYILFLSRLSVDASMTYTEWLQKMYNFIPFRNLYDFCTAPVKSIDYFLILMKNIVGNLVLFLPFGIFLPVLFSKCNSIKMFLLITLVTLFLVELVQFLTMLGAFDINDVILNLLGAIIGFLTYKYIQSKKLFNKNI